VQAPFGARPATITAREQLGPYLVLGCSDPAGPRPQAGQFYMLRAAERWGGGAGERPFLPRAFSVLRAPPGGDELQFMIEDVGPGTRRLCELSAGDELVLVGPLGLGFTPPREGRRAVLVGGGVGIAPLAIWQDQVESAGADSIGGIAPGAIPGADLTVLLGFRDGAHAAGAALLAGARVATDDGSAGHRGLVTELLEAELGGGAHAELGGGAHAELGGGAHAELGGGAHAEVYACGPPAMLEAVRALCAERGVPAQLALESGMACGYGACFGCVVATRDGYIRLCVDGPVLDAARLEAVR
jgi:NAD(P)H-flavin reductase